jgi:nudix-type nucleoside diphosphatase (YffH/AdpP family)
MKIASVKPLHEGWGRYLLVTAESPDGRRVRREVEDHGDAAGLLAYDSARGTALLVRQPRIPMLLATGEVETLEAAAGLIDGEETPEQCVRREAMEELGLRVREIEPVVTMQAMPGISTERIHLFLGPYGPADRIGSGGGLASEDEDVTVVELPLTELAAMADDGRLTDAKTLILLLTLRHRRPELFKAGSGHASV